MDEEGTGLEVSDHQNRLHIPNSGSPKKENTGPSHFPCVQGHLKSQNPTEKWEELLQIGKFLAGTTNPLNHLRGSLANPCLVWDLLKGISGVLNPKKHSS